MALATEEGLLRPREAAAWLKISERSLWAMANRGEIRAIRIGRSVRYDVADLQAFVDTRKTEVNQ